MIEVVAPGPQLTVQDLGRPHQAAWGIGPGGAADRGSLRLANRLVGNPEHCAAVEMLLGGATLHIQDAATIAVTGAPAPFLVNSVAGRADGPQHVPAGATVRFAVPASGLYSYLAVRGGVATEPILGSRSTDEQSGLGRALRAGDLIPVGSDVAGPPAVDVAPRRRWGDEDVTLVGMFGPRDDWFTDESLRRLTGSVYTVTADSNRVGVRLTGPALDRRTDDEMLSEPTLRGAVEVPPDGLPIVFGADHLTTCGYPVVAVLHPGSADRIAQCRPGQAVRFSLTRPRVILGGAPDGAASR